MSTVPASCSLSPEELAALRADIRKMPKVELHRHMEGAIRFSTLRYYYCTQVLQFDAHVVDRVLAARGEGKPLTGADAEVEAKFPDGADLDEKVREHFCVTAPIGSLIKFLSKFEHTRKLFVDAVVVERMAFENVEDCFNEGHKLVELRYSPSYIRNAYKTMDFATVHEAILKGVARATSQYQIAVGLIAIMDRSLPMKEVEEELEFVLAHKTDFVGIDLANDEASHPSLQFKGIFDRAAKAGMNITIHSGEVPTPEAPQWVWDSITGLQATRIGHGFNVMIDKTVAQRIAQETKVVFEVCPSSNYLCKGVESLAEHPLRAMRDLGLKVTLNTDDPGMFCINMLSECEIAVTVLGFTLDEVRAMMQTAYEASFIPDAVKSKFWPQASPSSTAAAAAK